MRFSNVRDTSFSVSWLTEDVVTGSVQVSTSPPTGTRAGQVRQSQVWRSEAGQAHHVTITGLLPETTYYVTVHGGSATDDNHGRGFQVTTGPTLTLPDSDNAYGTIRLGNGSPAAGCTVLARVVNGNVSGSSGQSALLSAQTDASGSWIINLGNARTESLDAPFVYSASGDALALEVQCSPTRQAAQTVDTAADAPTADLQVRTLARTLKTLDAGWNFLALPYTPLTPYTASRLCQELDRNTANAPAEVVRWQNGGWDGHVCGAPANDFPLDTAAGYFVRTLLPTFWVPTGDALSTAAAAGSIVVENGWNAVNGASILPASASGLCASVASPATAQEANRWWASGWDGHICGLSFNDFGLALAEGYFVKAEVPPSNRSQLPLAVRLSAADLGGVYGLTVANLRDTSATVIWKTEEPTTGQVDLFTDGRLVATVADVRGADYVGRLHYAVLAHLQPSTAYRFDVKGGTANGRRRAGGQGAFTTLAVPASVPRSQAAYGQVLQADGVAPLAGGLLLAYVVDADDADSSGRSLLLAALSDENGYWTINLGNARTVDGAAFHFSPQDRLELAVDTADGVVLTRGFLVSDTYPTATLRADASRLYLPQIER